MVAELAKQPGPEIGTTPKLEVVKWDVKPEVAKADNLAVSNADEAARLPAIKDLATESIPADSGVIHDVTNDVLIPRSSEDQARLDQEKIDLGIGAPTTEADQAALDDEATKLGVDDPVTAADKLDQTRENARISKDPMPPPDATPDAPWGKYPDGTSRPDPKTLPHDGAAQGLPKEPTAETILSHRTGTKEVRYDPRNTARPSTTRNAKKTPMSNRTCFFVFVASRRIAS